MQCVCVDCMLWTFHATYSMFNPFVNSRPMLRETVSPFVNGLITTESLRLSDLDMQPGKRLRMKLSVISDRKEMSADKEMSPVGGWLPMLSRT